MNKTVFKLMALSAVLVSCLGLHQANAMIHGVTGTTFNFSAKTGYIETPDGGSYLMWGYAEDPNGMQYPGPTMIVNQGDTITVNLTNELTVPVSIVFPGQTGVTATGGTAGLLTSEADPSGGTVSYSFTASEPGTYIYYSGTNPELQVEMGLVGALIVRPTGFDPAAPTAYGHPDSAYDRETLFLETEIDPNIHILVEQGQMAQVDLTARFPVCWFINGRCAPDTVAAQAAVQLHAHDAPGREAAYANGFGGQRSSSLPHAREQLRRNRTRRQAPSERARRRRRFDGLGLHHCGPAGRDCGRDLPVDGRKTGLGYVRSRSRRPDGTGRVRTRPRKAVPGRTA